MEVKENCGQLRCTQSFFKDLMSIMGTAYFRRKYRIPSSKVLGKFLSESLKGFEALKSGEGNFPLFAANSLVSEFGLEESAVCHWLLWIESMSTVPLVHYHHEEEEVEEIGDVSKSIAEEPIEVIEVLDSTSHRNKIEYDVSIEPITHI